MAVIVQADAFQSLIRKIGYSVGLEDIVNRVTALTRLYSTERQLTYVAWEDLVVNEFGRKESTRRGQKSATEHMADFFSTLNLIKFRSRDVTPLHGLECCSILYRLLGETEFETALSVILITYLIEADGDIFLNCLAANFESDPAKYLLESMVVEKRQLLTQIFKQPALQRRILDVIDIKSQQGHKGSSNRTADPSPFARRSFSLAELTRRQPLGVNSVEPISISTDYMRKVLPTRRGWAKALKLVTGDTVNLSGKRLLEALSKLGYREGAGPFLVWPFAADLQKLRIEPAELRCGSLGEWDLLVAVCGCFGSELLPFSNSEDYADVVELLRKLARYYKEGNSISGILRHQLPIFIAQPCIAAMKVALGLNIPPMPQIIKNEIENTRRMFFANIRGTEGGLVVGESQR